MSPQYPVFKFVWPLIFEWPPRRAYSFAGNGSRPVTLESGRSISRPRRLDHHMRAFSSGARRKSTKRPRPRALEGNLYRRAPFFSEVSACPKFAPLRCPRRGDSPPAGSPPPSPGRGLPPAPKGDRGGRAPPAPPPARPRAAGRRRPPPAANRRRTSSGGGGGGGIAARAPGAPARAAAAAGGRRPRPPPGPPRGALPPRRAPGKLEGWRERWRSGGGGGGGGGGLKKE